MAKKPATSMGFLPTRSTKGRAIAAETKLVAPIRRVTLLPTEILKGSS